MRTITDRLNTLNNNIKNIRRALSNKVGYDVGPTLKDYSNIINNIKAETDENNAYEYLDLSQYQDHTTYVMATIATVIKVDDKFFNAGEYMAKYGDDPLNYTNVSAVMIDLNALVHDRRQVSLVNGYGYIVSKGFNIEDINKIPRITREEFYKNA